jgi:hypothetical protein
MPLDIGIELTKSLMLSLRDIISSERRNNAILLGDCRRRIRS